MGTFPSATSLLHVQNPKQQALLIDERADGSQYKRVKFVHMLIYIKIRRLYIHNSVLEKIALHKRCARSDAAIASDS